MRSAAVLSALTLLLAGQAPLFAQQKAPDVRVVTVDRAEVRSGPSETGPFYVTNVLGRNARVEVVGEPLPDGWLKIRPPEGSFSYINTRFLQHVTPNQPNFVVQQEGAAAPVIIGSSEVKNRRPTVVGTRLKRGTQVTSIGQSMTDADGTWMPIEAPASEVRYLRASAVNRAAATPAPAAGPSPITTTSHSAPAAPNWGGPAPGGLPAPSAPSASPQPTLGALWQQAEQADRTGRIAEAIRLWRQAAAVSKVPYPAWSDMARRRADFLERPPEVHRALATTGPDGRTYPLGTTPPARLASPGSTTPQAQGRAAASRAYRGTLRVSGGNLNGQRAYRLDFIANWRLYVVPQPGLTLEHYVEQAVEVSGPMAYNGALRAWVMTAERARPLP